jgi:uncharacterized membrane protein
MRLDPRHLPYKHRLQLAIHQYLTLPALVVVLATGFYQVADVDFDVGGFWLGGTLTIVLVLGGMLDRRLEAMVERDIAASGSGEVVLPAEYQRRVRIEAALGGFASLLVFVAVYLTVTKPGL